MNAYNNIQAKTETQSGQGVGKAAVSSELSDQQNVVAEEKNKKIDEQQLTPLTEAMNNFMSIMNADLHFSVHEKTHRLMVRLVDNKTNKVLREFPPKDFLDTIAKIQEYIGGILDKKV
jgi:flagellar protein FlaG